MDDKYLIDCGFSEYEPTPFDSKGIEKCFQKRYDDEKGKRYFISIHKWESMTHPHTHEVFPPSYEYSVQLYRKDTHDALDLLFHSSWTLEAVESCLENLFNTGLFDYYETFDD